MSIQVQHRRDSRAVLEAVTPAEGEFGFDKDLKSIRAGDGATLGGILMKLWGKSFILTPAQLTANQNDYNPADLKIAETLLLDLSADWTITGLSSASANREISVYNGSPFRLKLANENGGSTAGNRFHLGADVVLRPYQGVRLIYSAFLLRWIAIGRMDLGVTDLPESLTLSGECRPAQVTVNQNDWDPSDAGSALAWSTLRASSIYVSTDASRNVTGLAGGTKGRLALIINSGANPLVLQNANASSTAANRFDFASDITLAAKQCALLEYDSTASRWKCLANTAGASVANGAVTAATLAGSALGASQAMVNGTIAESHAGSAVTFAVKTLLGADPSAGDPVYFIFNDGAGAYVVRTVTAALSFTISSGSSMGASNGVSFRLWLLAIDDAGTVRLGAINCRTASGITQLSEGSPIGSTAEGGAGAADSSGVIYTGTAVGSKFFRFIGHADYNGGLAAAGTWAASPSRLMLVGPGSRKPGDVLGMLSVANSSQFTTTSSTFQTTNLSQAITLLSQCNLVRYRAVGDLYGNTNGTHYYAQMHRGGTAIGPLLDAYTTAGGESIWPACVSALDFPDSAAAVTYAVKVRNGTGTATVGWAFGSTANQIDLEEIMG